jgi:predicted SAM-dependent methyltransferase
VPGSLSQRLNNRVGRVLTWVARSFIGRMWFSRRLKRLAASRDPVRLHLGCGPRLLPGWINIDFVIGANVLLDLRRPLPLPNDTVDYIFSEDFLEHLTFKAGTGLLGECARVLKSGGTLRIATPDLARLVQTYLERSEARLERSRKMFPSHFTFAQMFNTGMRAWGHQFVYDEEALRAVLEPLGFRVTRELFNQSTHPDLRGLDLRDANAWAQSMYIEAKKP